MQKWCSWHIFGTVGTSLAPLAGRWHDFFPDELSTYLDEKRADKKVSKFTLKFKIIICFIIIIL